MSKKLGRVFWWLLIMGLLTPFIHMVTDVFVNPITGLWVVNGYDSVWIAVLGAIPWLLPLGVLIGSGLYLASPDKPENTGRFPLG